MKDERIITERMETPPTRWEPDEDEGYKLWKELGKLVIFLLVVLILIWKVGN